MFRFAGERGAMMRRSRNGYAVFIGEALIAV